MNKKYQIVNSNQNEDCTVFYLLYIVLIITIIFVIYKIFFYYPKNIENTENFVNTMVNNVSSEQLINNLQSENEQLSNLKMDLENLLYNQSKAIYLSNNYIKVDESSYNDEINFLNLEFKDINLPSTDLSKYNLVKTESQLQDLIKEAKTFKNIYKPGDTVTTKSTFGINKDDICYRNNGKMLNITPDFIKKYPNCMVCDVINEDEENLYQSNAWTDTKTNIEQVCLYNPNTTPNSGIANLSQCKNFCNIKS